MFGLVLRWLVVALIVGYTWVADWFAEARTDAYVRIWRRREARGWRFMYTRTCIRPPLPDEIHWATLASRFKDPEFVRPTRGSTAGTSPPGPP